MKKFISIILALVMVISSSISCFAINDINKNTMTMEEINEHHNKVRSIINKISSIRAEKISNGNNTRANELADHEIDIFKKQLTDLGVEFVSKEDLIKKGLLQPSDTRGVELPASSHEEWLLCEYQYSSGGPAYNISVVSGFWEDTSSPLYDSGAIVVSERNFAAGSKNFIKIAASAASGALTGTAAVVANIVTTFVDVVSEVYSNITNTTIIDSVDATYTWVCKTAMHYVYVQKVGTTSTPRLSYMYNEATLKTTANDIEIVIRNGPNDVYINEYHWEDHIMVYGANNMSHAVNAFNNSPNARHNFTNYVDIYAIDRNTALDRSFLCIDNSPMLFI